MRLLWKFIAIRTTSINQTADKIEQYLGTENKLGRDVKTSIKYLGLLHHILENWRNNTFIRHLTYSLRRSFTLLLKISRVLLWRVSEYKLRMLSTKLSVKHVVFTFSVNLCIFNFLVYILMSSFTKKEGLELPSSFSRTYLKTWWNTISINQTADKIEQWPRRGGKLGKAVKNSIKSVRLLSNQIIHNL